jgi:DNA-binding GntR family transcriptional regulator
MADLGTEGFTILRVSTADQVATLLRNKILSGELKPGTPLQEVPLASAIGVARNTIREAMRVLVYEGLVRHSPRRGGSVTALTEEDVADIYKLRRWIELPAVDQAASLTPDDLRPLDMAAELKTAVDARDWNRVVELDMTFHRRLVAFIGSARLDQFYRTLLSELRIGLMLVDRITSDGARLVIDHQELHELLASGRISECKEALRTHLDRAETDLKSVIQSLGAN